MSGKVSRALPSPRKVDGVTDTESERWSGYGEQYVIPFSPKVAADEGGYVVLRNATPGTGVVGHAAPTTHDTAKPLIMLKNGAEAGGKRAYLDFIKLLVTAAGTAGTLNYATHSLDTGRTHSSGGEDLVAVNPNMEAPPVSELLSLFKVGAVVPGESDTGEARIVAHQRVRTVIPVVGDEILFKFGGDPVAGGMILAGTAELQRIIHCPPVIFGPGQSYHLVLWRASQSAAASYEVEIGLWLR